MGWCCRCLRELREAAREPRLGLDSAPSSDVQIREPSGQGRDRQAWSGSVPWVPWDWEPGQLCGQTQV